MADLDDFFAKRDKKKSGKKRFDTTEDLSKILEKKAEERKKLEEGKSQYTEEYTGERPQVQEDDEWLEQKEPEIDLTGLKVTELKLPEDDEIDGHESREQEGGGSDGPWKKRQGEEGKGPPEGQVGPEEKAPIEVVKEKEQETPPNLKEEVTKSGTPTPTEGGEVPVTEDKPPAAPAKYVPPSKRNQAQVPTPESPKPSLAAPTPTPTPTPSSTGTVEAKGAYVPPWKRGTSSSASATATPVKPRKPTTAPDIQNEEYFPSLGAS